MRFNIKSFVLMITFLIFGIAVSMQIRTIVENNRQQAASKIKYEEYVRLIDQEKIKSKNLLASIAEKEKTKNRYIRSLSNHSSGNILSRYKNYLDYASLKAGLTTVKGQGITIIMNDAEATRGGGTYDDDMQLIIHDSDILKLINDLKIAGANAISINEERIMPTSEIICAGPTMMINSNKYAVPFTIKAIGDMDKLYKAVDESYRVSLMRRDGLRIDVQKNESLKISKYNYDANKLITSLEVRGK